MCRSVGGPADRRTGGAEHAGGRSGKAAGGTTRFDRYKAAIKGLTQFGDRREGTYWNRAAVDWIEAQLRNHGCTPERHSHVNNPPPAPPQQPAAVAGPPNPVIASGEIRPGQGGSRLRGITRPTTPNNNIDAQPDPELRALNAQQPSFGAREQVYCTKVGTARPDEMYIVGAHMDGRGFGEGANDNGSGTALVMELARILSSPDVRRTGPSASRCGTARKRPARRPRLRRESRGAAGQGGSGGIGRYPEPRWLGMIQHDMMLFDHGMPRADGSVSPEQRPEADINIEFQSTASLRTRR